MTNNIEDLNRQIIKCMDVERPPVGSDIPITHTDLAMKEQVEKHRKYFGLPGRYALLRARVKTRKFCRTIYPPGWSGIK